MIGRAFFGHDNQMVERRVHFHASRPSSVIRAHWCPLNCEVLCTLKASFGGHVIAIASLGHDGPIVDAMHVRFHASPLSSVIRGTSVSSEMRGLLHAEGFLWISRD